MGFSNLKARPVAATLIRAYGGRVFLFKLPQGLCSLLSYSVNIPLSIKCLGQIKYPYGP